MLLRFVKGSFALIGLLTGYTLTRMFFYYETFGFSFGSLQLVLVYFGVCLVFALFFFSSSGRLITSANIILDKFEQTFRSLTVFELALCSVGLILGLITANLISIPIIQLSFIGVPISIILNILLGFLGISIAYTKKEEFTPEFWKRKDAATHGTVSPKLLDTSAIIDGRIADVCKYGFMQGEMIVPNFVLEELRGIADSTDALKRNRGRRGLDILAMMQKDPRLTIRIDMSNFPEIPKVDDKLLKLAQKLDANIVTTDYNLNMVAGIQGVVVLNLNELANAVKPIALPGEEMMIAIVKDGKEAGQGLGYLDDGTMVVVEGGKRHVGESVQVIVTSMLQTAAGKMIFAKLKYGIEKVV